MDILSVQWDGEERDLDVLGPGPGGRSGLVCLEEGNQAKRWTESQET